MSEEETEYHTPGSNEFIVPKFACSFCGKGDSEVAILVAAPGGVYICDSCVRLSNKIIKHHQSEAKNKFLYGIKPGTRKAFK